jgi:hypothetical protein
MLDLATVIRAALDLWQNPPFTELSPEAILACGNRTLMQFGLDLDLTADACFMTTKSKAFTFADSTTREKTIESTVDDISRILRVESRSSTSTSEDDWEEESHTSFENWNDVEERNDKPFCAFYGLTPALTMVVARDVSDLEFRIVYQVLRTKINAPDEILDLPDIYEPLLTYDMALEFSEMIDNNSAEFMAKKATKTMFLAGRKADALKRIDKWRRSQKGTSITTRRAFNDRQTIFGATNRRFTVRW